MDEPRGWMVFGGVLVAIGLGLIGLAAMLLTAANADELACRAAAEGLDELRCMNFEPIRYGILRAWGLFFVATGALTALVSWAWPRLAGRGRIF